MNTRTGIRRQWPHGRAHAQRGAALVIGLIFLVLISLIATVGMRQSITQERMAGGLRNESLARSGAESAVRLGERVIYDWYLVSNGAAINGSGIYQFNKSYGAAFHAADPGVYDPAAPGVRLFDASINDYTSNSDYTSRLAQQPQYVIEVGDRIGEGTAGEGGVAPEGYTNDTHLYMFRVTARAAGGTDTVVRTVESTYVARLKG
jgi:type IV pilus assembly protein PilX